MADSFIFKGKIYFRGPWARSATGRMIREISDKPFMVKRATASPIPATGGEKE